MLTIQLKNETTNSYDAIRRAMKAAYKDSAAYRMRQVEFDDSLKQEGILQVKIGEYRAMNLQLTCVVTDVKQLSMVVSDLMEDTAKSKKPIKVADDSLKVADPATDEETEIPPNLDGVGEGRVLPAAIQGTTETA